MSAFVSRSPGTFPPHLTMELIPTTTTFFFKFEMADESEAWQRLYDFNWKSAAVLVASNSAAFVPSMDLLERSMSLLLCHQNSAAVLVPLVLSIP